jgi:hypothetical protein
MEVFVKEKNMPKSCIDCEFCITTNIKNGHTKKYEEITQCCFGAYYKLDKINTCLLKSLEQHDKEIRADERKKVVEEIVKWLGEPYTKNVVMGINRYGSIDTNDLQDKLTEIKERK